MPHLNHQRGETRRSVNREVRCSCSMCGNPRRSLWGESRTLPELQAIQDLEEARGKRTPRPPQRTRKQKKPYSIYKRDLSLSGEPRGGWRLYRRYRTETARDCALRALRRSAEARAWGRRQFRPQG